ncbi:Subtilisin-like protease [Thalictrum thalictroides]|uniref:Subtilisin-like protease n=1 Tax=Thalictrum thalictroides TaxID=46969 RepID=A0A7J6WDA4_THATH|nr:Subtilisin-like protease [Thalictrum thalictroides]
MECTNVLGELGAVGYISINSTCRNKNAGAATLAVISDTDHGQILTAYINSTEPMASITPPMTEETTPSVAKYSCRGPNPVTQEILKPDIIAPGTFIVAAVSKEMEGSDGRLYDVQSGTSMATPMVAGVVGLLKLLHPEWSPAMIKSAIMTTASTIDNMNQPLKDYDGKPASPFAMGAGIIQPNNAADPGLVYDLTVKDYLEFLCSQTNFTETQLASVYEKPFTCPKSYNLLNFNYPAITVPKLSDQVTLSRIVTNVGTPGLYKVNVTEPEGISVTVKPDSLLFKEVGEKQTFELTLKAKEFGGPKNYVFGRIVWKDGVHTVSSPLVVKGA